MMASLLLFMACGFGEWLLYGWRQLAVNRHLWLRAALLVVLEITLGLWVTKQYVAGADLAGLFYAVGGGIGTAVGVCKKEGPGGGPRAQGALRRYFRAAKTTHRNASRYRRNCSPRIPYSTVNPSTASETRDTAVSRDIQRRHCT